ncbi:hypothetical protein ABW19_dt0207605 [Dactylella cylindrospora]|nr:hypothetical protein ABW19_dt0207605 [Dactylella cylindrospora]
MSVSIDSASGSSSSQSSNTTKASSLSIPKMTSFARNRATSISSTSIRGQCPECRDKRQDDMGLKVNSDALLQLASSLRSGVKATVGKKISGALYYRMSIDFEDGVSWLARIPKPWRSSNVNDTIYSEVSALRYLKKNTRITVPEVYHFAFESDPGNDVGASFILLEQLQGSPVPELDGEDQADFEKAKRFHDQLSDIILELSSHTFEKIGSIHQSPIDPEDFQVGPLYTSHNTYPLARGRSATNRGPYQSAFEFYTAFGELNYKDTKSHYRPSQPEICAPIDEELARYFLINKMIPKFSIETGFNGGPFVFQNWGFNSQNVLVDEECNITGIMEISSVIGPLTSLCKYPDLIYETKKNGPLFDRKMFLNAFLTREIPAHVDAAASPLADIEVRKNLMRTAHKVWQFENSILDPSHKHLHLRGRGGLYEYVFEDQKFSEKSAFKALGDQDPDFQRIVPKAELRGGQYSWDLPPRKQKRRTSTTKVQAKKIWNKAPWVKSYKEEQWVREYVRVHRHLPPEVKAYDGRRRSNGPEKAFYMAWAFIRCRDASYMRRKNQNRKRPIKVGGRNRSGSVRSSVGKRVRGWSIGGDSSKKAKGKAPVRITGQKIDAAKGWKRVFAGITFLNLTSAPS